MTTLVETSDLILIHIPKTAGGSIKKRFDAWGGYAQVQEWYEKRQGRSALGAPGHKTIGHNTPGELRARGIIPHWGWDTATKVAVVRNPFARAVSLWRYHWLIPSVDAPAWHNSDSMEAWAEGLLGESGQDSYARMTARRRFAQQMEWLTEPAEILRFESLAADWPAFCASMGLPTDPLPHVNGLRQVKPNPNISVQQERFRETLKATGDYRRYYNDAAREMVATFYKDDLEQLDYEF
jgi:hypothetical protein